MNIEQEYISNLLKGHNRSPFQVNRIHESDSEIIKIPFGGAILAVTTDALVEEISHSLYTDPYLIGWMSVTCCASDLAAVGAMPLGVLISAIFTEDQKCIEQIQLGIKDACDHYSLPLIGGDTNFSHQLSLTGTAIGYIQGGSPLMRTGGKSGDFLACSSPLGQGSLYAYQKLLAPTSSDITNYRPIAKLKIGEILKSFATSCIDTSDGLFSCLEDIMGINPIGFKISSPYENILSSEVIESKIPVPKWSFLAGHHGEYELVFTVHPSKWEALVKEGKKIGWSPILLGEVIEKPGIHLDHCSFDPGVIRETWNNAKGDVNKYFNLLLKLGQS